MNRKRAFWEIGQNEDNSRFRGGTRELARANFRVSPNLSRTVTMVTASSPAHFRGWPCGDRPQVTAVDLRGTAVGRSPKRWRHVRFARQKLERFAERSRTTQQR